MVRFDDDADDDSDDDDLDDDELDEDEDSDEDDEEDDDEPETWQVAREPVPAKSWHRLTSGFELPRLAPVFSSSAKLE